MSPTPDLSTRTSVIVATRAGGDIGGEFSDPRPAETIRSLRACSRHRDLEFIVVHDTDVPFGTMLELSRLDDVDAITVPSRPGRSLAALFNRGALLASGDVLLFANDRVVARSDEVVGRLVGTLADPTIGLGAPKLLLADERIEDAGLRLRKGRVTHRGRLRPNDREHHPAFFDDRDLDAASATVVAVRATDFARVGGWSLEAPERVRGVDLSLKLRREQLRLRWLSDVEMFHHASAQPLPALRRWEQDFLVRRWGERLQPTPATRPDEHSSIRAATA